MSSLLNKLTGHSNKDSSNTHHHSHDSHSNDSLNNRSTTTSTTQTTTSNSGLSGTALSGNSGSDYTGVSSGNAYGSTTDSTTSRTGAGYTGTGSNIHSGSTYHQQSGISGDNAMTRSEEQLRVNKATIPAGKAELNKYVTTEHVEQAVPVQQEKVVIEREPVNQSNMGKAMQGPDISEAHYETTLKKDVVTAEKEAVPIERIRLAKQTESSVENIGADLRKEHVDLTTTQQGEKIDNLGRSGMSGHSNMTGKTADSTLGYSAPGPNMSGVNRNQAY